MEQRLRPQLTGFTAAQAFNTVAQLVLKLWQHVHRHMLPGTKHRVKSEPRYNSGSEVWLYLVFVAADISAVAQSDRASHHEQHIVQTVELVDQIASFWSFIVLFVFSSSLQVLGQQL